MAATVSISVQPPPPAETTTTTTVTWQAKQVWQQERKIWLSPRKHNNVNSYAFVMQSILQKNNDRRSTYCRRKLWKSFDCTKNQKSFSIRNSLLPLSRTFISQDNHHRHHPHHDKDVDQINCCAPSSVAQACPLRQDTSSLPSSSSSSSSSPPLVLVTTSQSSFFSTTDAPVDTVLSSSLSDSTRLSATTSDTISSAIAGTFINSTQTSFLSSCTKTTHHHQYHHHHHHHHQCIPFSSANLKKEDHLWSIFHTVIAIILSTFVLCNFLPSFTFSSSSSSSSFKQTLNTFRKPGNNNFLSKNFFFFFFFFFCCCPFFLSSLSSKSKSYRSWILLSLLLFTFSTCCEAVQSEVNHPADLCYLSEGGSSQTFIVNEATLPNSLIGTLQVIGNVAGNSNAPAEIELSIESTSINSASSGSISFSSRDGSSSKSTIDSPVRIELGTKNLILSRSLDKEGPEGESGLTVVVRCARLPPKSNGNESDNKINSNWPNLAAADEQSSVIPLRLIVTDANDHHPEFVNIPYTVNVSEQTPPGSVLLPAGRVRAVDGDQQGPFSTVQYFVMPGPFSHLVRFESTLGGALLLDSPLDFEAQPKVQVQIKACDQGEPPNCATEQVTINVQDADDQNPRFVDEKYSAWLPEKNRIGEKLDLFPRVIKAIDPDVQIASPIEYELSSVGAAQPGWEQLHTYLKINTQGEVQLSRPLTTHLLQLPITLVIRATQADNRDRYALTTLSILGRRSQANVGSTNEGLISATNVVDRSQSKLQFINKNYSAICAENAPTGQIVVTVQIRRFSSVQSGSSTVSAERPISYQLLDDNDGHFTITTNGEIRLQKSLDYEHQRSHVFRVLASDGLHSDICSVNVSVQDVNDHDPQFSQPYYAFYVPESRLRPNALVGELRATDGDEGDQVRLSIKGPFANHFKILPNGQLRLVTVAGVNVSQCHLIVQATDTGNPPRSSSVPVSVQLPANALLRGSVQTASVDNLDENDLVNGVEMDDQPPMDRAQRNDLLTAGGWLDVNAVFSSGSASVVVLIVVLAVLLAILLIIIITLSVHVLRQRKLAHDAASSISNSTQNSGTNSPAGGGHHHHHHHAGLDNLGVVNHLNFGTRFYSTGLYKHEGGSNGSGGGVSPEPATMHGSDALAGLLRNSNSLAEMTNNGFGAFRVIDPNQIDRRLTEADSAIASDASSNDGKTIMIGHRICNGGNNNGDSGCSGSNSSHSGGGGGSGHDNGYTNNNNMMMSKRHQWPPPTTRVKKLTWEDERLGLNGINANSIGVLSPNMCLVRSDCELDPDVSVAPLRSSGCTLYHQHSDKSTPDVTVYF